MLTQLVLIMGISGSGKSTVANTVAEKSQCIYLDADDFHSPQAKEMMAEGIPITDKMRELWIEKMLNALNNLNSEQSVILAYSGLKQYQRELFNQAAKTVKQVFLQGDQAILIERLNSRKQHFFNAELLNDQLNNFELPTAHSSNNANQLMINIEDELPQQIQQIIEFIND